MVKKVHITKKHKRIRLKSPKKFDPKSFRIIDPGRVGYTKIIVACPKGKFKKGRCTVGTVAQSILLSRKDFKI